MQDYRNATLIKDGRVYDHDGDPHRPAAADVLIEGDRIVAVERGLAGRPNPAAVARGSGAGGKLERKSDE